MSNVWDSVEKPEGEDGAAKLGDAFANFPPEGAASADTFDSFGEGGFGSDAPEGVGANGESTEDASVVDAVARDVPAKRRSMLPVILGVGIVALSIFVYIGYQLVQTLFPSEQKLAQLSGTSVLGDASFDAPAMNTPSSVVPLGQGPAAAAPSPDEVPFEAPVAAEPVAKPIVAEPLVVTPAPLVVDSPVVEPIAVTPAPAPAAPVVKAPAAEPVRTAIAAKPDAVATKPTAVKPAVKQAAKPVARQSTKPVKTAARKPSTPDKGVPKAAATVDEASSDLGRLSGYTVLAFEPKHGEFQQAWIRDPAGKIAVVSKGDTIGGARISDISFRDGAVKTTRGVIRQ